MVNTQSSYSAQDILEFFLDSGIDCALSESPQDRFLETKKALEKKQLKAQKPNLQRPQAGQKSGQHSGQHSGQNASLQTTMAQAPATIPNEETIKRAEAIAAKATSLEELSALVEQFEGCNLKNTAKHTVMGEGKGDADVMFICDAPGRDEDLSGKPFVGEVGILLDKMLLSIGLNRESIYIAHIIPWRPPGNRQPTPFEQALCRPFIECQISLIKPKHVVFIGAAAAKTMLDTKDSIVRLRGKWKSMQIKRDEYPCISMFHPQYLLRQPLQKKLAWRDLLSLKQKIAK